MDTLQISVTRQLDGVNFSLDPLEEIAVEETFGLKPIRKFFLTYDRQATLDPLIDRVSKFILPALTGITDPVSLKKVKQLLFIEAGSRKKLKEIVLN